jgi:ADP-ribosylglycohydrolase
MGCWLGKGVGGTLGQLYEGREGPLAAVFYEQLPDGMIPNDDLDLQVLWACLMDKTGPVRVDRSLMERAWLHNVRFPWNEYGVAIRNLQLGLHAPYSGSVDNWYSCGEGAVIRTEIWACLAAGDPNLAARYAYEDSCVDHAGDGVNAALFMAALQAQAFVESDADKLLDVGLSVIDPECTLATAVSNTRRWVAEGLDWKDVRARIMEHYGSGDFTDVRMNTAFIVLGWLKGKDFAERILICNNCGQDTDSSAGSLGSTLAIIDPDCIPDEWLAPIGRELVLNPEVTGIDPPRTLDEFTDLVLDLRLRMNGAEPVPYPAEPAPRYGLKVRRGFTNYYYRTHIRARFMPVPGSAVPGPLANETEVVLPGTSGRIARHEFLDDVLLLRYQISLSRSRRVRVMFNTTEQCQVWVAGEYAFGRETGGLGEPASMQPAPDGPPMHQFIDKDLAAGTHEVVALVRRPVLERDAEWVFAVGEPDTGMWVPEALGITV